MSIPTGSARRVVLASAVVVALLVPAMTVTIWLYGSAIHQGDRVLDARTKQTLEGAGGSEPAIASPERLRAA
jgi:hypothetical protein